MVANPIRLPCKFIVDLSVQDEQLTVFTSEPSARVNQISQRLILTAKKLTFVTFFVIFTEKLKLFTSPYICTMSGSPQQSEE